MRGLPNHFMISQHDGAGALYDTRAAGWHKMPPLRAIYSGAGPAIASPADLKAALRAGEYTDLGGYPLYFVTADGEALSFDSVRANLRECLGAYAARDKQWRVVACQINYEDADLTCAHSGERIPSAYAED